MTSSSHHTPSSNKSLWAVEKFIFVYIAYTILLMACFWDRQVHPIQMLIMRLEVVLLIIAMWMLYCWRPCKLTRLLRVLALMITLSWFYPDTYEVNRVLPNLDHLFAGWEQQLFGCQPALLFSQVCPWDWFSELMCLGYVSYFPLMVTILFYYFFRRYKEFGMGLLCADIIFFCLLHHLCHSSCHGSAVLLFSSRYRQDSSRNIPQSDGLVPDT